MQKRSLLVLFLALTSINLVSAQFYGNFSLGNLLSSIDPSTMILGVIFVISFALLQFALSKYFKEQKTITTVISFALSLLIIWGINQSGVDYGGYFYNFFFFLPSGFVDTLWPLLLLAGFIYLWVRNGLLVGGGKMLIIIGLLLNIIAFSGFSYEPSTPASVGIFLIIVGVILIVWGNKKKAVNNSGFGRDYTSPTRGYSGRKAKSRRPKQPKGPGFFRRNMGRAGRGMKSGLGKGARGAGKGAGWFGRKAKQTGQEWTKRDEQWRRQQEEAAKQKKQQKQSEREQRKQEKTQQKQARKKQERQTRKEQKKIEKKEQQKMLDYKKTENELQSLIREYNDLQRKDPNNQRLKDIAKRIKELRKQKKS